MVLDNLNGAVFVYGKCDFCPKNVPAVLKSDGESVGVVLARLD